MTDIRRPSILTQHTAANQEAFTGRDWLLFLAVSGIWGSSFLFIAEGLEVFEPGLITWVRVGSGALALWAIPAARVRIERSDRWAMVALSVLWVGVPFTLFPLAQQHITSAVAGMLNGATPLFAALVGATVLGQRLGVAQRLGLVIGLGGVVTISLAQGGVGDSAWAGIAMVVGATFCYGFAVHVAAPLQAKYGSLAVMARMLGLATVWTAPFGIASIPGSSWQASSAVAVGVLGVLGTGIAFALMGSLVGRVGSTRASFITYVVPVVALSLGIGLRGDDVRPVAGLGVVLVIAGALLASRREGGRVPAASGNVSAVAPVEG